LKGQAMTTPATKIAFNAASTAARYDRLQQYVHTKILTRDRQFCCSLGQHCRSLMEGDRRAVDFLEGQLSYVGTHFDLSLQGRDVRILLIGRELGRLRKGAKARPRDDLVRITLDRRRELVQEEWGNDPTLKGMSFDIRTLVGEDIPWPATSNGETVPLRAAFALANLRLCSVPDAANKALKKPAIDRNCLPHLRNTIYILEPTVIIVYNVANSLPLVQQLSDEGASMRSIGDPAPRRLSFDGRSAVVLGLNHPSQPLRPNQGEYCQQIAIPALKAAREFALAI